MKIKKILIANRGEIVLRILSTCREMGIEAVTIYSEVDAKLRHVYEGNESYSLGEGDLLSTYLNQQKIIELAQKAKVDAIHPGYGFLSENAAFCKLVTQAGFIFIGPSSEVMALMGDKKAAKVAMEKLNVPCLPGYHGDNQDAPFLLKEATKIGYPLLIKAAAGGGGKGMRVVGKEEDFIFALEGVKREAFKAFGDESVLLEKFITRPRHIEVQVLSDKHGNHLHLFERECSIQRRNQKIVEESPSPAKFMTEEKRKNLTSEAVKITRFIGYEGAGTLEFLFDEKGDFYFLEMNTRLQVEHPVTEMVTGVDLVKLQIEVAQGNKISFTQDEIKLNGHAIEVRIYAEDPDQDFLPSVGKITYIGRPSLKDTRLEVGFQEGDEVGVDFDPMLAKLVTWGKNREQARLKMLFSLKEVLFQGLITNRSFLGEVLEREAFVQGDLSTQFLKENNFYNLDSEKTGCESLEMDEEELALFMAAFLLKKKDGTHSEYEGEQRTSMIEKGPWENLKDFRNLKV